MAHPIVIPRLGWSMEEGTFIRWLKQEGAVVRRGEPLFELEGEKATQEIESTEDGMLRLPVDAPLPGTVLKVGSIVGYLLSEGEPLPIPPKSELPISPQSKSIDRESAASQLTAPVSPAVRWRARQAGIPWTELVGSGPGGRIVAQDVERAQSHNIVARTSGKLPFASPRARRVAAELRIDWTRLVGTGRGGRIRERDVLAADRAAKSASMEMAPPSSSQPTWQHVPHSARRKVIAQRLMSSRDQVVPVTLTTRADATELVSLRETLQSDTGWAVVPSYQDIITKLVGEQLKYHRILAGRWTEQGVLVPDEESLHIGMAVDTDDGLLVPVLRNVVGRTLAELAAESRRLVERGRGGRLRAEEMQGAVFTITNLGAYGIDAFTPVIHFPEVAILGLGAIRPEPMVQEDGNIGARQRMFLSLTFDHRVVDGAPAARFLQSVSESISALPAGLWK